MHTYKPHCHFDAVCTNDLEIKNAKFMTHNFSGVLNKTNPLGFMNFCVFVSKKQAKEMIKDGWNVRVNKESGKNFINVSLKYDVFDCECSSIAPLITIWNPSHSKKVYIDRDSVYELDFVNFIKVNLYIDPFVFKGPDGNKHIKAYLDAMDAVVDKESFDYLCQDKIAV